MGLLDMLETTTFRDLMLERCRVSMEYRLGKHMLRNLELREFQNPCTAIDDLAIAFCSDVLSNKLCEDSYSVSDSQTLLFPKTPWQHFKNDYMPKWFIKKFPIKYLHKKVEFHKTIKITRRETYPMCDMDIRNNPRLRVQLGTPVIKDEVKIS